jgi:hypothetical protein
MEQGAPWRREAEPIGEKPEPCLFGIAGWIGMNRMDVFVEQRSFEVPDLSRLKVFGKSVIEPISQRKAPDSKPQSLLVIPLRAQRSAAGMPAPALDGAVKLIESLTQTLVHRFTDIHDSPIDDGHSARLPLEWAIT